MRASLAILLIVGAACGSDRREPRSNDAPRGWRDTDFTAVLAERDREAQEARAVAAALATPAQIRDLVQGHGLDVAAASASAAELADAAAQRAAAMARLRDVRLRTAIPRASSRPLSRPSPRILGSCRDTPFC